MKKTILYITLALVFFAVNFMIYNISFNMQATPYLSEEQRLDGGILMLKTTIPAYLISSFLTALAFYFFAKSRENQ